METLVLQCLLLAGILPAALSQRDAYRSLTRYADEYELPSLPYAYDELEPYVDEATLRVHHLGHHKAYTTKMNAALKDWRQKEPSSALARASIVEILQRISEVPSEWRTALKNNGGGFVNHVFYWSTMCPHAQARELSEIQGSLYEDIVRTYGNFSAFKTVFSERAAKLFGSGYVWLTGDEEGKLDIVPSANQDSPLSLGLYPLLVLDVWEHAYYLKHQNVRGDYISDWWGVTCWEHVQSISDWFRSVDPQKGKERSEL